MYKVVECPECFELQTCYAQKIFRCVKCLKSSDVLILEVLFESIQPSDAVEFLKKLKLERNGVDLENKDIFW